MIKKILLSLILFSFTAFAQNGEELLKNVQNKYKSIKDLIADIQQTSSGNLSGKIAYKQGDLFRVELKNMTIISNGSTIWNFNKKDNKVIISNVDKTNPSTFSLNTFLDDYPGKTNVAIEKSGDKNILTLTPKNNQSLNFNRIVLTVNKENLVEKIIVDKASGTSTFTLSNYKVNQNLDDAKFNFIPPKGSNIVDLR